MDMDTGKIGRLSRILRWCLILFGLVSIIFAGMALGKDCQYNAEIGRVQRLFITELNFSSDANTTTDHEKHISKDGDSVTANLKIWKMKKEIPRQAANHSDDREPELSWSDGSEMSIAFWKILEPQLGINSPLSYDEKLETIDSEFSRYRRPAMVETISFLIVSILTVMDLLYLICTSYEARFTGSSGNWGSPNSGVLRGISMVGLMEYANSFYLISGLLYLLGSILLLASAVRYEIGANLLEFPFDCTKGFRDYPYVSVCQDYGAKIFAGVMEFAMSVLCGILSFFFIIMKRRPAASVSFYGSGEEHDEGDGNNMELRFSSATTSSGDDERQALAKERPRAGSFGDAPKTA